LRLSTCPAVVDFIRHLLTNGRQFEKLLLDEGVFGCFGKAPRPVIGSIGLEPVAWHRTWERHAAPQLNSRFERKSGGRHMEGADWAAWMAVKMIVQSALRTESADFAKQRAFILGDGRLT
jgi:ABC transporter substrate binding protein (PQQ-dependent alcohol dehydrogenase system)